MKLAKHWILLTLWLACFSIGALAASSSDDRPGSTGHVASGQWRAGQVVTVEAIESYGGLDKCFAAEPIPDDVWRHMQGKSFTDNPYIGRDDLRHIRVLHWDRDQQMHTGEMVVNKVIADRVVSIFRRLFEARYPIQRMLLPDVYADNEQQGDMSMGMDERQMRDNNTSCFCYRAVAGSKQLSKHARGLAIDINPLYNPYYKDRQDRTTGRTTRIVQPATARQYCDRTKSFPYKIDRDDLCYRLFTEAGFAWGGNWRSCKDFQHFEFIEQQQ